MATVNRHLSTAVNGHLPKPKHYYQRLHLQYGEALVRGTWDGKGRGKRAR
jgi:hypothetical protein